MSKKKIESSSDVKIGDRVVLYGGGIDYRILDSGIFLGYKEDEGDEREDNDVIFKSDSKGITPMGFSDFLAYGYIENQ